MFKKQLYSQWHLVLQWIIKILRGSCNYIQIFCGQFSALGAKTTPEQDWRMLGVMSYQGKPSVSFLFVTYPG